MSDVEFEGVRLMITKRAAATTRQCTSPYTYYSVTCQGGFSWSGCYLLYPCGGDTTSSASTSAAAASSSSSVTATSTQTSTKTSSAHTKTTSSSHRPAAPSQTITVISSSQTSLTTSISQASSTTSSTSSQTATPFAATSPATALNAHPLPSPHPNTAAVAAGTVGAIVGAIIALILMLLVLRWRKRRTEDRLQATQHENDLQSQKFDANEAGSAFQVLHVSESAPAYRDADHSSLLYPGTNHAGNDGNAAYTRSEPYSAESSLSHTQPGAEMLGSMPDPTGKQPELEVPAFHTPAELSLNAERSSINVPRKTPSPSRVNSSGQGGLRQTADGSVMHPNLVMTAGETGGHGAKKTGNNHVMSWMSYDGDESGPGYIIERGTEDATLRGHFETNTAAPA